MGISFIKIKGKQPAFFVAIVLLAAALALKKCKGSAAILEIINKLELKLLAVRFRFCCV
ncbi:MAG: hypothetical protein JWR61_661 [Ferruginibacter sp.]|nr:hypothetical protein [Ferruginibacter sp.]